MSHAAYPGVGELTARLRGYAPITDAMLRGVDLGAKIAQAIGEFETRTGRKWVPASATRTYDAPPHMSPYLDLRADLASLTSVSVGGVSLTLNTDFYLLPENADADGKAWTMIEFVNPVATLFQSKRAISIVGTWGAPSLPDQAWSAIISRAAALCRPEVATAITGGLSSWSEADGTKESYGDDPGKIFAACNDEFEAAVKQLARVIQA